MKTTENSSNDVNESIRRLFSGILLGSLLLFITTARLTGQCSVTLSSAPGSDHQTLCINTAINDITYITSEATGADFSGLPAGVTGSWVDNVVTITGTPNVSGTFNFVVTATGGTCENITASGTISVIADNTITMTSGEGSDNQTLCVNTAITDITYSVTGATYASVGGLPQGLSAYWESNEVLITGTPAEAGSFNYLITLSGGCGNITESGSVTVNPLPGTPMITPSGPTTFCAGGSVTLTSSPGTTYLWSTGATTQSIDVTESGSYTIQITDDNGCQSAQSVPVIVTVNQLPTTATITTTPLNYCGTLITGPLGGNTPSVGTGAWSIFSGGTGTFSDGANGNSTFTATSTGTYILRWTISNGTCSPTSADVTVNFYKNFTASFVSGWNWFSVNTLHENMSLNNILDTGFTDGDYIKNQTSFAFYSSEDGWQGSFSMIDPNDLYIVRVQNAAAMDFCGTPVNVNATPIPVVPGWNWVGYLPGFSLPISDALGSLTITTGDYIKNQTGYAEYYGTAWFGSLLSLNPGEGYMMRLTNPGELIFPDSPAKNSQQSDILPVDNTFSPHKYEFNGSVTAELVMAGITELSEKDILYAYADDEIRGLAHGMFLKSKDSFIFPLMIHSNKPDGETISFRYYKYEQNKFYTCLENLPFKADMIISNPFKPFRINLISDNKSTVNDASPDLQFRVYPNPVESSLNIEFGIAEISDVRLTISDQYGKTIKVLLDQEMDPDHYSIQWIYNKEPAGVYFIRLQTGERYIVQKVVLVP